MNERYMFRGKRVDNGEWCVGHMVHCTSELGEYVKIFANEVHISPSDSEFDVYQVNPATIGQCTGLRDKNNVLIFEGDVFKTSLGFIAVVEWEKEGRFLGFTVKRERRIVYVNREPLVEIIGNIHDNPDLLTPESEATQ